MRDDGEAVEQLAGFAQQALCHEATEREARGIRGGTCHMRVRVHVRHHRANVCHVIVSIPRGASVRIPAGVAGAVRVAIGADGDVSTLVCIRPAH